MAPHRGTLILVLGILSLVGCGFFAGIPAVIMGNGDLKKMDAGVIDPEGRQLTNIGRILGIVSLVLTALGCVVWALMLGVFGIGVVESGGIPQSQ